jgi:hypothetical protein
MPTDIDLRLEDLQRIEHFASQAIKRGAITKTGNSQARRTLVESACGYRPPAPRQRD